MDNTISPDIADKPVERHFSETYALIKDAVVKVRDAAESKRDRNPLIADIADNLTEGLRLADGLYNGVLRSSAQEPNHVDIMRGCVAHIGRVMEKALMLTALQLANAGDNLL